MDSLGPTASLQKTMSNLPMIPSSDNELQSDVDMFSESDSDRDPTWEPTNPREKQESQRDSSDLDDELQETSTSANSEEPTTNSGVMQKSVFTRQKIKNRAAKVCPLEQCGRMVISVPRHLRNYHFYSREASLLYKESVDTKLDRPYKTCPVPGCTFRTKRLDKHLARGKEHKHLTIVKRKFYQRLASKAEIEKRKAKRRAPTGAISMTNRSSQGLVTSASLVIGTTKVQSSATIQGTLPSTVSLTSLPRGTTTVVDGSTAVEGSFHGHVNSNSPVDGSVAEAEGSTNVGRSFGDSSTSTSSLEGPEKSGSFSPVVERETLLLKFGEWLMTRSGGSKARKEAKKNASHCSTIFTEIGLVCLDELATRKTLDSIEANFIAKKMKCSTASTVKNHLLSLKRFSSYLRFHEEVDIHGKEEYDRIQAHIKLWNTSLGKDIKIRNAEKNFQDQSEMITPELIQIYSQSDSVKEAVNLLQKGKSGIAAHTKIRNYLVVQLAVTNATRTGGIINMTVQQFQRAKFYPEYGNYIVEIPKHKTVTTHQGLQLGLTKVLYSHMSQYIEHVRSKLPALDGTSLATENVFVTYYGKPLGAGDLANAITLELAKSGYQYRASCTKFRKMAVTMVCSVLDSEKKDLARFMKHSDKVQTQFYDLSQMGMRASRMSNLLTKMVMGEDITDDDLRKEKMYLEGCEQLKKLDKTRENSSPCSTVDCGSSPVVKTTFEGQRVLALYAPDKTFYRGTVMSIIGEKVKVVYDDNYMRTVDKSQVKPLPAEYDICDEQKCGLGEEQVSRGVNETVQRGVEFSTEEGGDVSEVDERFHDEITSQEGDMDTEDDEDAEKGSPFYMTGDTLKRAVDILDNVGHLEAFLSQARGYDISGVQQALVDASSEQFVDPTLYLNIDVGTRYILRKLHGLVLTEREQTRTCGLTLQYIAQKIAATTESARAAAHLVTTPVNSTSTSQSISGLDGASSSHNQLTDTNWGSSEKQLASANKSSAAQSSATTTSTTAKKPATKTTAANKPATKTTAANKPATKTTTAKKPAIKTTAAKKPATKTTAAKKPATKTIAAKKPATKTKKPATKTTAAVKPAIKTTAAKKAATKTTSADDSDANIIDAEICPTGMTNQLDIQTGSAASPVSIGTMSEHVMSSSLSSTPVPAAVTTSVPFMDQAILPQDSKAVLSRCMWTKDQKSAIKKLFEKEIVRGSVRRIDITTKLRLDPKLHKLLADHHNLDMFSRELMKKIEQTVRTMYH